MSMLSFAMHRKVAQVMAKLCLVKPKKGFTATKFLSGHSGAILLHAFTIAVTSRSMRLP